MSPKNSSNDSAPRLNAPPVFSAAGAGAGFFFAAGAFLAGAALGLSVASVSVCFSEEPT